MNECDTLLASVHVINSSRGNIMGIEKLKLRRKPNNTIDCTVKKCCGRVRNGLIRARNRGNSQVILNTVINFVVR